MRPGLRATFAAVLIAGLAGCLGEGSNGGFANGFGLLPAAASKPGSDSTSAAADDGRDRALRQATLAGGRLGVRGPRGYCVDPATLRRGLIGGFALIASCNSLSGGWASPDVEPVVMTVQVQPALNRRQPPSVAAMAAALAPLQALRTVEEDGLSLVHMASGGDAVLPRGDPKHWRGAMMINGHLVGLAVYAPRGSVFAGTRGQRLIRTLAQGLRAAN